MSRVVGRTRLARTLSTVCTTLLREEDTASNDLANLHGVSLEPQATLEQYRYIEPPLLHLSLSLSLDTHTDTHISLSLITMCSDVASQICAIYSVVGTLFTVSYGLHCF